MIATSGFECAQTHTHILTAGDALVQVSEWWEGEPWSSPVRAVFAVFSEAQSGGTQAAAIDSGRSVHGWWFVTAGNKGRRQRAGLRQRKEINVRFYWHYIYLNLPHAYLFKGNEIFNNLRFYLTIKIEWLCYNGGHACNNWDRDVLCSVCAGVFTVGWLYCACIWEFT